jgi:hypothetical protein
MAGIGTIKDCKPQPPQRVGLELTYQFLIDHMNRDCGLKNQHIGIEPFFGGRSFLLPVK